MDTIYYLVLIPMTYLAFAVFITATAFRLISIYRSPKHPATLQIFPEKQPKILWILYDTFLLPSVRKHKPLLWVFLLLFHLSFLLLIIGHLELISDFGLLQIIEHQIFLGGGYVGLVLMAALLFFLFRRFVSPYRDLSVPEDYYLLILLFLTALFGSQMDLARNWFGYDALTVENYQSYLTGLILLRPEIPYEISNSGHSFMLVLHVFFANLFLMMFPFSKIMHSFFTLAMNKLRRS